MALTPEDVVNKRFNPTKFREGYDQDEVDDFLDEVVVELRRLGQENEELRQRLVAADARISELQRSASQAPVAAPAPAAPAAMPAPMPAPVPTPAPVPAAAPEFGAAQDGSIDQSNTNNLLQLARRLHEEHVREGMEKRDQLIAEGHSAAARIVSEAEGEQRAQIEALVAERTSLETRIEELRIFESEYRDKLKGYIEGQLRELESAAPIAAAEAQPQVSAAPSYAAPGYDAPSYAAPSYETPAVDTAQPGQAAPFGDFGQQAAPQPATSTPPAYAAFPAPQVTPEYPAAPAEQVSQQPEYPVYSQQQPNEYPGLGGN